MSTIMPHIKIGADTSDYFQQPRKLTVGILQYANIPERLWRSRIDKVPSNCRAVVAGALDSIRTMPEKSLFSAVIYGGVGVGKSAIATLFALQFRRYRRSVYFTAYRALRDAKRSSDPVYFDPANHITVLERAKDVQVLVLDDVTPEDLQDRYYGVDMLMSLVSARANAGLSTIITTRQYPDPKDGAAFPGGVLASIPDTVGILAQGENQTVLANQSLALRFAKLGTS